IEMKDTLADFDGKVDIDAFWKYVTIEIPSKGFVKSNYHYPYVVSPSYHKIAPWKGPCTRNSNIVYNTEYAKLRPMVSSSAQNDLREDHLLNEVLNLKVSIMDFF
ncbi:hypothetical protein P4O66_009128, partial [Electrophorus voltai]